MQYSIFTSVTDPRVQGRTLYKLSDILTAALLTLLSNGVDFSDMEDFAEVRGKSLGLFEGTESTPSHDTFQRTLGLVDPDEMANCLSACGLNFLQSLAEKQIVIDGKKLRGANPRSQGTKGEYILNAYVSENHFVVGQHKLQDKENEIIAIPKLLDKIDITEAIVSIDAIGTQVNIAQKIVEMMGHYLLAVKENQKELYEALQEAFLLEKPINEAVEMNEDHGRIETRTCRILSARVLDDRIRQSRANLTTLIEITSEVTIKATNQTSVSKRFYISDEDFPKAAYFNFLVRGHWTIENQLHWMLDVLFLEDSCRSRINNTAENMSIMRKLALQVAKNHRDVTKNRDKSSIKKRLFKASLSNDYMIEMIKLYNF